MASEKIGPVPPQQVRSSHPQPQLVFPESFVCGPQPSHLRTSTVGDPKTSTRELTSGFHDHQPHYFHTPSLQAAGFRHQWNANCRDSGGNASVDDDEEDDYDGDEEVEGDNVENIVTVAKVRDENQEERFSATCSSQKNKDISAVVEIKEGNVAQSGKGSNDDIRGKGENAGGQMYYQAYLNQADGQSSSSGQKDTGGMENGCTFSGRKDNLCISEPGESLREILSDPLTRKLMDDAMILPCGHSFGSAGVEQIIRMKACYTCSQPVSEDSIAPNLSLRVAVQAFQMEEELHVSRAPKRRRERYDMACQNDRGTYGDTLLADHLRGRGVQFPFSVTDRVIIQGNKRTPPRFVGREAIVTAQCLNGWYVVKTLDNAESVKLQYRSLAKVAENPSHGRTIPNWL
ncbi:U-box domain-containing protein 62-like [Dorcoceras hygrometricum]|uniref:U-box domain-containing protein 62-like n=1 Tax=Dorcoceras hygrometricum TaxID=472368 RepID=A0A2Z7BRK4_9LAMI|nr:U-box domain-containing protein 62-like [Dorcoceras hygrometricum]